MAIFVVIGLPRPNPAALGAAITAAFPSDFRLLREDAWLIAAKGSAQELSETLGVTDGRNGVAVIVQASGYFGRGPTDIWSWIKAKWEATSVG